MLNLKICNLLFIFSNCFAISFSRISTLPFSCIYIAKLKLFFLFLTWKNTAAPLYDDNFYDSSPPINNKKAAPSFLVWCEKVSENVIFMFVIKWFAMRNNRKLSFVSEMDMHLWNCKMTGGVKKSLSEQ